MDVGQMPDQHLNLVLLFNPSDKFLIPVECRREICHVGNTKKIYRCCPLKWRTIINLNEHFSSNPYIYGYIGQLPEHHFNL